MYSAGQRDWEPGSRSDVRLAVDSNSNASDNEADHFLTIVNEIKLRIEAKVGEHKRSVLVFFKDLPTLKRFYVSRSPSISSAASRFRCATCRNAWSCRSLSHTGFA